MNAIGRAPVAHGFHDLVRRPGLSPVSGSEVRLHETSTQFCIDSGVGLPAFKHLVIAHLRVEGAAEVTQ